MGFDNAVTRSLEETQSRPIVGREEEMVENSAGGYGFAVTPWDRLMRFLMIGTEGGTYYASEREITIENTSAIFSLIKEEGKNVVDVVKEVSTEGRSPKNDQALFVLAAVVAKGDPEVKAYALEALPQVARIGTHLFMFVEFLKVLRALSGRAVKRSLANWYLNRDLDSLVYQVVKYRQRNGWSHRDILRLSHPMAEDSQTNTVFKWVTSGKETYGSLTPDLLTGFNQLQKAQTEDEAVKVLANYKSLSHEMVPTEVKKAKVWKQLLPHLPMTALIRNLPTLTRHELLVPMSDEANAVAKRVSDSDALAKARVHPINMLTAHLTYGHGSSLRGSSKWTPTPEITEALEKGFYAAFHGLKQIDKRVYIGLDVSGSMFWPNLMDVPGFHPAKAGAALALCLQRQCDRVYIRGFQNSMVELGFTKATTLKSAMLKIEDLPFGRTDCAQPMIDARQRNIKADAFIVITDSETWCGGMHPVTALQEYRKATGINAKLVVVAMTSSGFTIADPADSGMMDVVGFDAALPRIIEEFIG